MMKIRIKAVSIKVYCHKKLCKNINRGNALDLGGCHQKSLKCSSRGVTCSPPRCWLSHPRGLTGLVQIVTILGVTVDCSHQKFPSHRGQFNCYSGMKGILCL